MNLPLLSQTITVEMVETPEVLKKLNAATRQLAELKGLAASIPNQHILINALGMQEAKDSSAVENIVTTHDELFSASAFPETAHPAAKEVARYRGGAGGWLSLGARNRLAYRQSSFGDTGGVRKK